MSEKEIKKTEEQVNENKKLTTEETIVQIMGAYLEQELGNKVSQFSVQGLMNLILMSIKQNKLEQ